MPANTPEPIKRPPLQTRTEMGCLSHTAAGLQKAAPPNLMGNGQAAAIPISIWVDPLLDAVDVRCWGLIRTQAVSGAAAALSLNQLLQGQLHYAKATVSKVIYVLRLTRWMTLCQRPGSNEASPNRYVVHDTPCTLKEAMHLDAQYLTFVEKQLTHKNKQVRHIAQTVWKDYQASVAHDGCLLAQNDAAPNSSFIDQLNRNVRPIQYFKQDEDPPVQRVNATAESPVQKMNPVKNSNVANKKQRLSDVVQKLNQDDRVCSSSLLNIINNNKTTTTGCIKFETEKGAKIPLIYPPEFNADEIKLAELYLKRIEPALQQAFLDETAAKIDAKRKTSNPVRNPIGYLSWLCQSHSRGLTALTSLSVRYAEKRALALKKQEEKPKGCIEPMGQVTDKKNRVQSAEDYKSRIIALRAGLNLSKQPVGLRA